MDVLIKFRADMTFRTNEHVQEDARAALNLMNFALFHDDSDTASTSGPAEELSEIDQNGPPTEPLVAPESQTEEDHGVVQLSRSSSGLGIKRRSPMHDPRAPKKRREGDMEFEDSLDSSAEPLGVGSEEPAEDDASASVTVTQERFVRGCSHDVRVCVTSRR